MFVIELYGPLIPHNWLDYRNSAEIKPLGEAALYEPPVKGGVG